MLAERAELRRLDPARGRGPGHLRHVGHDVRDLALERRPPRIDRLPGNLDHGRLVPAVGVGGVVEDGVELEIFLLRERVVFMVVALGAGHRGAHPGAHRGVHPVHDRDRAELLVDRAPLVVRERVAVEGGGHPVVDGGIGQEVAGDLPDRELVERHVGVERADHPVAPAPDRPRRVVGVPRAVGVAGEVEPLAGHVLAVAVVGEEPIDEPLDGVGRRVGHEGIDLIGRRRQAREVEREPPGERGPVGLGLRREPLGLEAGEDEAIDVVSRPGRIPHRGHVRPPRRDVGPVRLVGGARGDPAPQEVDLGRLQRLAGIRRGHHHVGIRRRDPGDQFARVGRAGNDGGVAVEVGGRPGERVESQAVGPAPMAVFAIGAVATDAPVREERLDLPVEGRRRVSGAEAARRRPGQACRAGRSQPDESAHGGYLAGEGRTEPSV